MCFYKLAISDATRANLDKTTKKEMVEDIILSVQNRPFLWILCCARFWLAGFGNGGF